VYALVAGTAQLHQALLGHGSNAAMAASSNRARSR
jgi:hypothetical protein